MVLKKEDDLFCLHLPFSTISKLEDSGIVNMGDFINSDIEEIIDSGRYDLREIKYIRKRHRQYASGEIEIVGHYLHRDFEAGADIDDKYFRHRDGLRYKDVVLEEIIDDAHDLKELKDNGFSLLSQLIDFKARDYKVLTKLEAKNRAKVMKMVAKVKLLPAKTADPVESSMGERLFYKIWNCLNELVGVELVNHYSETIDIYEGYIANNGADYNLADCYNDKKLGSRLIKEICFQEILQRYLFKLVKSYQYGLTFEEIFAMVPVFFQDSSEIYGYINTLIDQQRISQLLPGRLVAGAPDLIAAISCLLTESEMEAFMLRLENNEVKDIAAKLNVSKARIRYLLKRSFNKINDSKPVVMIDAYIDLFNHFKLSKEKWEEILGGEINYNYMELRIKNGVFGYRYSAPISKISEFYWIPESIRQHFMKY